MPQPGETLGPGSLPAEATGVGSGVGEAAGVGVGVASALAWRLTILSSVTQFIGGGALVALNRPGSAAFFAGALG